MAAFRILEHPVADRRPDSPASPREAVLFGGTAYRYSRASRFHCSVEPYRFWRERLMRITIVLASALLLGGLDSAKATGGFWCNIDDQNLKFSVRASVPRSSGHPFNLESTLQVYDTKAPKEFRTFRFEEDDLSDHWHEGGAGGSLKLRFLREGEEGESFGRVELIIKAPWLDEAVYKGGYTLTSYPVGSYQIEDAFKLNGFVSCSAD
jgi:hypothetical protein